MVMIFCKVYSRDGIELMDICRKRPGRELSSNVTAIVKAFERKDALRNLYTSIRLFYPDLRIIIIDDSRSSSHDYSEDPLVRYVKTEFDIGLSEGRNRALSMVDTEYFLLLDDDFVFTQDTDLTAMLDILESTTFSIVSGGVVDFGKDKRTFFGTLLLKHKSLYLLEGVASGSRHGLPVYDFVLNFFMARTDVIKLSPWDSMLKLGEHEDFFFNLKKKGVLITDISERVTIDHYPEVSDDYAKYRNRVHSYQVMAAKKNGYRYAKRIKSRKSWLSKLKLKIKLFMPTVLFDFLYRERS